MNQHKCGDCQKPFKAFTVEVEREGVHKPSGDSWTIWYYEEGVDVHKPNSGHSYFCYKCRPEHKF